MIINNRIITLTRPCLPADSERFHEMSTASESPPKTAIIIILTFNITSLLLDFHYIIITLLLYYYSITIVMLPLHVSISLFAELFLFQVVESKQIYESC